MPLEKLTQLDALKSRLIEHLQWTPFDCISNESHFRAIERQQLASAWLGELDKQNDYRYQLEDTVILAERLAWDSNFFAYDIVRLNYILGDNPQTITQALRDWLQIARDRGVTYIFTVALPENITLLQALGHYGFQLIETRLTYHQTIESVSLPERFPVRVATEDDIDTLGRVAQKMVNPFDRFHADNFITNADADRMMSEWVRASIQSDFADFVLVPDVPNPKAFCTIKAHQNHWADWQLNLAQSVVLGAVDSSFKGWYRKLISESNHQLATQGATHVFWKTQLNNRPAIRTAEKLGYRLGRGEHVFRLVL